MDDRRSVFRKNAFTFGGLLLAAGEVECLVWDLTDTGAQIEVEGAHAVPDRFAIRLSEAGPAREATVAWRRDRRVGIAFEA